MLIFVTIVCLLMATLFYFVWPEVLKPVGWKKVVLHYFHPLVWVLLAIACLIRFISADLNPVSIVLACLAALCYLIFMGTFLSADKKFKGKK